MKKFIAPSILGLSHGDLKAGVAEIITAGAEIIHVDVMDGQFVPPITFGDGLVKSLAPLGDLLWEAHLMTLTPERHFEAFAASGCKRIIFHQEVAPHAHRYCGMLKNMGVQAGIALNPGTAPENVRDLLDVCDLVLVMTVNPGWGAQTFIESMLRKIEVIRGWSPTVHIEVDGGINPKTLRQTADAGANVFVVGNYLTSQSNLAAGMKELLELCG